MASYRIFGNITYLNEGLRWCDTLVGLQQDIETSSGLHGGWWDTGYHQIYIADTGTAVTALALCTKLTNSTTQRETFLTAMEKFQNFVLDGCKEAPAGGAHGKGCPPPGQGWVHRSGQDKGALGDGYYMGKLNMPAYTISTATTGSCFFPTLYQFNNNKDLVNVSKDAIQWILNSRDSQGGIPYIITPPSTPQYVII